MNEINVKRLLLGGAATFVVWIALEIFVEHIIGRILLGNYAAEMWQELGGAPDWQGVNQVVSLGLAMINATVLIWLYASLRPMYGVGSKTALITCAFFLVWGWSLAVNVINLGLLSARVAFIEGIFESIEAPIAILAGAAVYEGTEPLSKTDVES